MAYTYEESLQSSIKYFDGDELAAKVWVDKYALRDINNILLELNPNDMHLRIASEFARIEKKKFKKPLSERQIFDLLEKFKYIIPQGSPMFGIGNNHQVISLSNCYLLDVPLDSYSSILEIDEQLVNISKRRGGVGIDLSNLRPKGSITHNSSRTSTGIVTWMERYSNSIREVGQCVESNQRVLTSNGLKKIKDVKPEEMVWTKNGWTRVVNVLNNGKKKVYRLTTDSGYSVVTSKDHVFQTFSKNGELTEGRLSELEAGDGIVLSISNASHHSKYIKLSDNGYQNSNNKPDNCKLPELLDENLAYFLGYSYGDGCVNHDEYGEHGLELACSNNYQSIKNRLNNIVLSTFGYKLHFNKGDGDLETLDINNKTIIQFLKYNDLLKQKSSSIVLPEKIIQSTISVQMAFIAGYFDADGDCADKKAGYRFRSVNVGFLKNIQVLLSTYGILSKISFEDRIHLGWRTLYTLAIVGKSSTEKFLNCFSNDVLEHDKVVYSNIKLCSIKVNLKPYSSKRDCWLTPFKAKSFNIKHNNYNYCPDNTQYLSLAVAEKLQSVEKNVITNLAQDKISTIEYVEELETYDLVLESEHLFWCEGLYLHNSGRRGALMLTLDVHHPDILDFATIKNDSTKVTGANISIRLTKEFLDAVKEDKDYQLRFPVDSPNPTFTRLVKAKDIWNTIIHSAWMRAEPGLLMWDNVTKNTPADCYDTYKSRGTNPCSEINLSPLDSCRLLCLNLYSYVNNPFTKDARFDHSLFIEHTQIAQRLMDDLVDLESEKIKAIIQKVETDPEPEDVKQRELRMWKRILKFNDEGRRTGTGITALADCLAALGIKYGSEQCKKIVAAIFHNLKMACYKSSIEMAKELGPFACYESRKEKDCPYIQQFEKEQPALYADMVKYGRRNICLTTVAPTGTVSIMTQTTSGIEPLFMIGYKRRKKINPDDKNSRVDFTDQSGDKWQEFTVYHPKVKEWMDITGETDVNKSPWFGCCANDINWEDRVDLQSIMQQHICHAISSTVNLPETVSELDVAKIYEKAFSSNCKGITVYRDNCRTGVLVSNVAQVDDIKKNHAPKRPRQLKCNIHHTVVKGVAYYVAVGILNNDPYEVFVGRNTNSDGDSIVPKSRKSGFIYKKKQGEYIILDLEENPLTTIYSNQCEEHEEALARMTSVALRHGADVHFVTESLLKTRGEMNSFAKSIARSLKEYIKDGTSSKEKCPECGNTELKYQEGCKTCSCGFSKCS